MIGLGTLEQAVRLNLEDLRQPLDCIERSRIYLPLERRHVGAIDPGKIGQPFLRQRLFSPDPAQVRGEDLSQAHDRQQTAPSTLHPRSILYTGFEGGSVMRASLGRVGSLTAVALLVAACGSKEPTSQSGDEISIGSLDGSSSEESSTEDFEDSNSAEPFAADTAVNPADYSDEGGRLEGENAQEVWVGMSGIPQGCTLTNYHDLRDVQAVMQNDNAVVLEKTPNLIILRKSAPKGQYKLVYTTDEALCEVVVSRPGFSDESNPDSVPDQDGTGN